MCIDTTPSSGQILKSFSTSHHPSLLYLFVCRPVIDLLTFTPNPIVCMLCILLWFDSNRVKMNPSTVSCCFRPLPSVLIKYRAHSADTTETTPMQVLADFNDPSTILLAAVNVSEPHRCLSPAPFLPLHLAQCLSTTVCELASFSNAVLVLRHAPLPPCHLFSCSRQLACGRVHLTDAQLAVFCLTSQSNTFIYFCWEFGHTCLSSVRFELGF